MTSIRENLKVNLGYYLSLRGISQKDFSERLGVSQSSVTNWVKGKNSPDIETVAAICNALDISVTDLFGVEAANADLTVAELTAIKKYRTFSDDEKGAIETLFKYIADLHDRPIGSGSIAVALPLIDLSKVTPKNPARTKIVPRPIQAAGAGGGQYAFGDESTEDVQIYLTKKTRHADYVVRVSGDSMEPTYPDGCEVAVMESNMVPQGHVGIFVLDGELLIKERGFRGLVSHNEAYDEIPVREWSSIRALGIVLGRVDE